MGFFAQGTWDNASLRQPFISNFDGYPAAHRISSVPLLTVTEAKIEISQIFTVPLRTSPLPKMIRLKSAGEGNVNQARRCSVWFCGLRSKINL